MGWLIAFLAIAMALILIAHIRWLRLRPRLRRRAVHPETGQRRFARKQPPWVCDEVIRLKALMPHEGCRAVAAAFNARHVKRGETVGK